MDNLDELVGEFVAEAHEHLDSIERDVVALEDAPDDSELLARLFRAVHTIKGTCGFFGFSRMEKLTHAAESLMAKVREGDIAMTRELGTALLATSDGVREMLLEIERTGLEGEGDYDGIIRALEMLQEQKPTEVMQLQRRVEAQSETTVRVDVVLLDKLMNLTGELVLARNQIKEAVDFPVGDLDRITNELQETVTKARMQPIARLWRKLPRVVRDLAEELGKEVRLELQGHETELDRNIIEVMRDPLLHMVRNMVDHGIESEEERRAAGKPDEAHLLVRAFHEGGQVNLELSEDGRGIDPERMRDAAVRHGVMTRDRAAELSDREAVRLIFLPGISTADRVTRISGRGVGMDVAQSNIERLGGSVDVLSEIGKGTTFRIKLPLTLAIVPALVVGAGPQRYAIPQANVGELVRLHEGRVEWVYDVPVYRLRGRLLPLVFLSRIFDPDAPADGDHFVLVRSDEGIFGLVVDAIHDTQDIVAKPLNRFMLGAGIFSGATILGDGKVALILDVAGLAKHARLSGSLRDDAAPQWEEPEPKQREMVSLLLFQSPDDGRMVLPLEKVARLEEFPIEELETAGRHEVVQYRGEIMPLVRVSEVLPERRVRPRYGGKPTREEQRASVQVAVYAHHERRLGLVVDRILDIIEVSPRAQRPGTRPGIQGSVVLGGRVTEILDLETLIRLADPTFFEENEVRS